MGIVPRSPTSRWELTLKRRSYRLLEKLFSRDAVSPHTVALENIRSILVIRQHDQLGDFLLATPVIRALRESCPHARLGLVAREYFEDIASMIPFVDELLVFCERLDRWTWSRLRKLWTGLRKRWDLCIVLNTVSHSLTSDLLAHLTHAPLVLGSSGHVFPGCSRNFFYNLLAPVQEEPRHQTERNLDIVRYIGIDTNTREEMIYVPESERRQARQVLQSKGVRFTRPVIGLHIGAGKPDNRWPVRKFADLARSLHFADNADVLVFWGPDEDELQREFSSGVDFRTVNIPPTTLRALASLYTQCDVIVCNDSGPMHVAAAAGSPTVALFAKTDPKIWKPIGNHVDYVRSPDDRIENIHHDDVLRRVRRLLKRSRSTTDVSSPIGGSK